jgi:hypothetical protein
MGLTKRWSELAKAFGVAQLCLVRFLSTHRVNSTLMKTAVATSLVIIALIAPAVVGKPHKGGGKPSPPQQQAPPPAPAGSQPPSARLSQFTTAHLDAILSPLDQRPALPRTELSQLRAAFADESAKGPEAAREQFTTAIAVCDALNATMDEREQAVASLQGSESVHGPSDLGARRKDVPSHGTRADARLAKIEQHRERHEEANRKQEAAQKDDFLTQQHKNNWTQRTLQVRQHIQMLIMRQSQAERAQQPGGAANAAPASNTITLDKPVQVKVKYGTATLQAGTTLPVVSRDASGVVVQYMGENVLLPP